VLGVPGTAGLTHISSAVGGTVTTLRRVAGVLWTTVTTTGAGTEDESVTVTPEDL
jgi:UDP-N-acetylmuramyl tripeptide synthase